MHKENPYRLEDMDTYSNVLYLKGALPEISVLAHRCVRIDKYRPETCFIVGNINCMNFTTKAFHFNLVSPANYYSVTGKMAESVEYFKRALKLNRSYHLAWTLLGHDYIEMKNANAAIECYRRALSK